jgi:hypothetical protein
LIWILSLLVLRSQEKNSPILRKQKNIKAIHSGRPQFGYAGDLDVKKLTAHVKAAG